MADKKWLTEHRVDDKKGVITSHDGKTFEYDIEGLTEYSIEKNRSEAVAKASKYFDDTRGVAQHDFANEKVATTEQANPV